MTDRFGAERSIELDLQGYPMSRNDIDDPMIGCVCAILQFVIQEWTGTEWVIVDDTQSVGRPYRPLDSTKTPGEYVGQRVRTPCD